jgi:hypothetical protein
MDINSVVGYSETWNWYYSPAKKLQIHNLHYRLRLLPVHEFRLDPFSRGANNLKQAKSHSRLIESIVRPARVPWLGHSDCSTYCNVYFATTRVIITWVIVYRGSHDVWG